MVSGALSVVLGLRWGIHGIVLGTAIEMFVTRSVITPWLVGLCTGIQPVAYMLRHVIFPGIKGCILPVLYALAVRNHVTPDYPSIFLHTAVFGLVFAIGFPWLVIDEDARRLLSEPSAFSRASDLSA